MKKCSSGKEHSFATAGEAWRMANGLVRHNKKKFGPVLGLCPRAYMCNRCHQWHVTSKPLVRKRRR